MGKRLATGDSRVAAKPWLSLQSGARGIVQFRLLLQQASPRRSCNAIADLLRNRAQYALATTVLSASWSGAAMH